MLEAELNRAFITQTVQETFDGGESVIRLQRSPVASITSVTVTQYDKTTETVDESLYTQHGNQLKYFTWLNNRESEWPHGRGFSALSVVYVCGYGADASAVPGPIKLGLLQLIAFLYEHRGDVSAAFPEQIKKTVRNYYVPMFL
jgi:uncharacterized phiE125 gp8 family phage protein